MRRLAHSTPDNEEAQRWIGRRIKNDWTSECDIRTLIRQEVRSKNRVCTRLYMVPDLLSGLQKYFSHVLREETVPSVDRVVLWVGPVRVATTEASVCAAMKSQHRREGIRLTIQTIWRWSIWIRCKGPSRKFTVSWWLLAGCQDLRRDQL